MRKTYPVVLLLSCALLYNMACQKPENKAVTIPKEPFEWLSEYNLFLGSLSDLNPNDGVVPYDLNSPLFTDYAHKARFVWIPPGESANYKTDHALEFPLGSVLIKNFYFLDNEGDTNANRRIIETRILIKRGEEWDAHGYIWNDEQTDARHTLIGGFKDVSWVDKNGTIQNIEYIIPNRNQCKGCHEYRGKQMPIGPKVRNLNKEFAYIDGSMNQLEKWAAVGYLKGYQANMTHESVVAWDDDEANLEDRAMAYLDINCGHCHNPDGAGNTSGLTLVAEAKEGTALGIYKPTVSAGAGTGGHTYSIVPGEPDKSIMVYRMRSTNPGAMMPELGRTLVHEEGVDLIEQWIAAMDPGAYSKEYARSLD